MTPIALINNLTNSGVCLKVNNGNLSFESPKPLSTKTKELLRTHKAEIIKQLAERKADELHEILNRMIAAGVRFDTATDTFEVIDERRTLTESDTDFLTKNKTAILVQLQQSLLTKNTFAICEDLLFDFAFEIEERQAIRIYNGANESDAYNQAVIETTKKWFKDLLEVISE